MFFVLEPSELCSAQTFRLRFFLGSKGQGAQRQEPGMTNAARPCCCMLVQGLSLPASAMYGTVIAYISPSRHRRNSPHTHTHIPPHPHHPFMADPFNRSFRGAVKRQAHSTLSKMCNVRKRESWRGRVGDSKRAYNLSKKSCTSHFREGTFLQTVGNHCARMNNQM